MVATRFVDWIGTARSIIGIVITVVGLIVFAVSLDFRVAANCISTETNLKKIEEVRTSMNVDLDRIKEQLHSMDVRQQLVLQKVDILLDRGVHE